MGSVVESLEGMQRTVPEPERRYRRPAVSCTLCRKRKIRCDRETPCSTCVRTRNEPCVYEGHRSPSSRQRRGQSQATELRPAPKASDVHSPLPTEKTSRISRGLAFPSHPSTSTLTSASPPASQRSDPEIDLVKTRIRQLEDQLSKLTQGATKAYVQTPDSHIETTSDLAGTFTVHQKRPLPGQASIIRHIMYKTRLFGRSHWMHGATQFQESFKIIKPYMREEMSKVTTSGLQRCKLLANIIKSQRSPPWPSIPTADLPPRDVADKLVDCYLRTLESIYRILHIPTFKRDYDALWLSGTKSDTAFMVQLKLVLAIGATISDEQFSLRASAIRWVHEAQTWLSEPVFKSRLSIESLQTNLLFLIARETAAVGGELVWISAGSLFRTAVHMGLHRDPTLLSNMTIFAAEMRRRLWNTVLEITLKSSMDSGGPPFVSMDDFDTAPPSNFDDSQLLTDDAVPKSEDEFTQMSIAVGLRNTFPLRLAITKFLNNIHSNGSYEETLRLDKELRALYKTLSRTLQACNKGRRSLSQYETRAVDMIMCRYLLSLHIPFFGSSFHEAAYAFSRKAVIDTALKIWAAMNQSSCIITSTSPPDQDDLVRFTICSSGFFRIVAFQASFVIAAELQTQLHENESLGPAPLRPDLISVLNDAKSLMLRCIEVGETNIKNYLLICVVSAQIDGLMRGIRKDEFPRLLIKAAQDAVTRCLSILEEKAAQCREEVALDVDELDQLLLNTPADFMEGWDFMMSDPQLDFDYAEPMG